MSNKYETILKHPEFRESEDFIALRKKGIELIEKLGSTYWTDYNIHDPGITLLELLCFAQTEVGFKLGFSIEDLLAPKPGQKVNWEEQCFYTPREILTVNPLTINDWRKKLIDKAGISNAWMNCNPAVECHPKIYASCRDSKLVYKETEHPIKINGFWEALLELEVDPQYGDLNGGKVFYDFSYHKANPHRATAEIRFAPWHKAKENKALMNIIKAEEIKAVKLKDYKLDVADEKFHKALRSPLLIDLTLEVTSSDGVEHIQFIDLPLRIWFRSDKGREDIVKEDIKAVFEDVTLSGPVSQYFFQLKKADEAVNNAIDTLHAHRNLAEDYCRISTIPVMDVGICADIEVAPDADIEAVLGEAYYLISEYLNPVVKFYTLSELLSEGTYTEEIFLGPKLDHGFILDRELEASNLRSTLYTSDIINILMDIEGIIAVKNIVLTRFDETGKLVESNAWELKIEQGHQPRFYTHVSKVLVFKDDLPFLPNQAELHDTLQLWRGIRQQNKVLQHEVDLKVPQGEYLMKSEHYPLAYSLPETYGVGPHGLKEPVTEERKAQAAQLKAYLLLFDHLLAVYLKQLEHFRDLLSVNPGISRTYFTGLFSDKEMKGVTDLYVNANDQNFLELLENREAFLHRRNGFLDHQMARFAESFNDYALMLYQAYGSERKAKEELIFDKIHFLEKFPQVSANRARAFHYKREVDFLHPVNVSGLGERIKVVLGLNGAYSFIRYAVSKNEDGTWEGSWYLDDEHGGRLLQGTPVSDAYRENELRNRLKKRVDHAMGLLPIGSKVKVVKKGSNFVVELEDETGEVIAFGTSEFSKKADAENHKEKVTAFIQKITGSEKILVVEHILLRPRNQPSGNPPEGDPLLPVCIDKDCNLCGEEDPYSFRITVVLNGEQGISNSGISFRQFAEKMIRRETPAHLGVKICWVSGEQLEEFEAAYIQWIKELAGDEQDPRVFKNLMEIFKNLKSVYPQATLHDCIDGDDENRVRLNNTII